MCEARLWIGADVSIRPAVKRALLHAREVIGRKIIAKSVALLNAGVEFSGGGMECERGRVAHPGGKRGLAGAVGLEALNRRLDLRFDPDIAGRPDADKHDSRFWIQCEMAVLMTRNDAKHAFLRDHLLAIGRRHGLALLRRHVRDLRLIRATGAQRAADMRHAPDSVLIRDQNEALSMCKAVRCLQVVGIAL